MKKYLAVILAVAMLSFAGAAMAASPTLTAAPVSVQAGGSASVTVTATAGHPGGQMGAISVGGLSWASISGNTVTFAPNAAVSAGTYTATVTAVETYTDNTSGHATIATEVATGVISVTVSAPAAGTYTVTRVVETVTTVTRTVTVISQVAQRAAVVQTFTEVVRTVTQSITVAVLAQVDGMTTELATLWESKAAQVETARSATVALVASDPAKKAEVFPGLVATADVTPRSNTTLVAVTSSTTTTATVTEKLATATDALGGAGKALSAQEAVRATESGTYSFVKTFGKALYNTKIKGHNGRQNRSGSAVSAPSFKGAAVDNSGVAFINSAGDVVDTIPDDSDPENIMPGYVTMLVVMEAGQVYEPVVYATEEDLADNNVAVDTAPVTVEVNVVEEKEETVVVTVDESGNTTETAVVAADDSVVTAMKAVMGDELVMVPAEKLSSVATATVTADNTAADEQDLHVAARTAAFSNLDAGTYYTPITFNAVASDRELVDGASFVFYPDGIAAGTVAFAQVFDSTGTAADPATVLASSGNGGYLAFVVESTGEVRTADTNNTLESPTLAVKMKAKSSGGDEPNNGGENNGGENNGGENNGGENNNAPDPGGSSGGCTSGFSALALAVLGAFIARKK